jgi:hypothetical protein
MKKKLFEIFVCILLLSITVPATSMTTDWTQTQKLLILEGTEGDLFGCSVSLAGDTALIGAYYDENLSGSAYVFTRTGTTWTQQATLLALERTAVDSFGISVSLSGDTALIGACNDENLSGSAYVFTRTGTTWTEQAKLLASDGATNDEFGCTVSLSGDTAVIGARSDDDQGNSSGSVYVFTRSGTIWTQQAKLLASDGATGDQFGYSVSISNNTALIGAWGDDDNGAESGSAYVFTRTGTTWTQQTKLHASDPATKDYFGSSVALADDTALIGAYFDNDNRNDSGSVYVFTRTGPTWTQQAKLLALDGAYNDNFGFSISLGGDTALIGAPSDDDNADASGSAYVFTRTGTTWTQQAKLHAVDSAIRDFFGYSVSIYGDTALIGAQNDDDKGVDSGSAYIFIKDGDDKPNEPPLADFTYTSSNPKQHQTITFDASASYDLDGFITMYDWDWNNDGIYDDYHTNSTATHSWEQTGNYSVVLRVTDSYGATNTKTKTIPVDKADQSTNPPRTPGFELVIILCAITASIMLWKKKRKNT